MGNLKEREHRVTGLSELADAPSMRPFEIGEWKCLLVRLADGMHAVNNLCPHARAPLHEGALCGKRLVCPWHQSVFDVTDGTLMEPPALDGLERCEVRIDGDDVIVTLPETPVPPAPAFATKHGRTVLIVGAGAAGQVAAETLRKEGFAGRVVLVGKEPEPPYDRTNLTKHFLSGKAKRDDLPLRRRYDFFDKLGVERRVATVTHLNAPEKTATLDHGERMVYDAAIVATGGTPQPLGVPGADDPRVCLLRTVADVGRVMALLPEKGGHAVAIGASFIGMEAASSLAQRGVSTTVISPDEVPFERQLGREVGASIRHLHERSGVRFLALARVARLEDADAKTIIDLEDGDRIAADVVIVGVGIKPATGFVHGVEHAADGGIVVDGGLHAGHDLYAVGDVAHFPLPPNVASGGRVRIEHWRVAQQHAALAARNVARTGNPSDLARNGFVPFFWTYHFEQRMNHVGFARKWDRVIFDGDPEAPPFIAYYICDGVTVAAAGTHRDADLAAVHELLRMGRAPSEHELLAGEYAPLRALTAT